jgi:hypothetical protein
VSLFLWAFVVPLVVVSAVLIPPMAISSKRQLRRQREHAELVARADYEHDAICRGDIARGLYGRYQPPPT